MSGGGRLTPGTCGLNRRAGRRPTWEAAALYRERVRAGLGRLGPASPPAVEGTGGIPLPARVLLYGIGLRPDLESSLPVGSRREPAGVGEGQRRWFRNQGRLWTKRQFNRMLAGCWVAGLSGGYRWPNDASGSRTMS